jgi:ABC-type Fe3+ transport system permease subunit
MQTGQPYSEPSQATTVLVLGILSLVVCGVLGPVAWSMGNTELAAIDAGRRPPENRGTANAGRILGIIATVLLVIAVVLVVLALILVVAGGSSLGDEFERIGDQFNSFSVSVAT